MDGAAIARGTHRGSAKGANAWFTTGVTQQVFRMDVAGHHHRVEATVGRRWKNSATWWRDGEQVAALEEAERELTLSPDEDDPLAETAGAVVVRFTATGSPLRATHFAGERADALVAALMNRRGLDLEPEPGSPAALREERMRARPVLYASRHVVTGAAKVFLPIVGAAVLVWLLARIPSDVLPDLPSIPLPNLPSIPWPHIDLPAIPWPDWQLPGWLEWVTDHARYVIPVLIGIVWARREVARRRKQDELREQVRGSGARDVPAGEAEQPEREEDEPETGGDEGAGDVEGLGRDVADEAEG